MPRLYHRAAFLTTTRGHQALQGEESLLPNESLKMYCLSPQGLSKVLLLTSLFLQSCSEHPSLQVSMQEEERSEQGKVPDTLSRSSAAASLTLMHERIAALGQTHPRAASLISQQLFHHQGTRDQQALLQLRGLPLPHSVHPGRLLGGGCCASRPKFSEPIVASMQWLCRQPEDIVLIFFPDGTIMHTERTVSQLGRVVTLSSCCLSIGALKELIEHIKQGETSLSTTDARARKFVSSCLLSESACDEALRRAALDELAPTMDEIYTGDENP